MDSNDRAASTLLALNHPTRMHRSSTYPNASSDASRAQRRRFAFTACTSRSSGSAAARPDSILTLKSLRRSHAPNHRHRHRLKVKRRTRTTSITTFISKPPSFCPHHVALRLLSRQRFVIIQPFPCRASFRAHHQQCLRHLPFFQRHQP